MATVTATTTTATRHGLFASGWTKAGGLVLCVGLLLVVAFCSLAFGSRPIELSTVRDALFSFDGTDDQLIVRTLRGPRTILGLMVGGALGLAGAVMQGVTRNPLADPGLLGINAGAALAVVPSISAAGRRRPSAAHVWFALAARRWAASSSTTLGSLGRGGATPVKLAIAGAALTRAVLRRSPGPCCCSTSRTLDRFRFWAGRLGRRARRRRGDERGAVLRHRRRARPGVGLLAQHAGPRRGRGPVARRQRVGLIRAVATVAVVLLCGGATAAAGPIGFVGLTVPHIARAITGPDHRWILPWSMVLGPSLVLGADVDRAARGPARRAGGRRGHGADRGAGRSSPSCAARKLAAL